MSSAERPRVGRPRLYDWDDKRDICYELYVVQKKTVPEIITHFANLFGVDKSELPATRQFHQQFSRKWHFPSRRLQAQPDNEEELQTRIKELWELNYNMKDIREELTTEGWGLNNYEFNKLRKKLGINNRMQKGFKLKRKRVEDGSEHEDQHEPSHAPTAVLGEQVAPGFVQGLSGPVPALSPEEQARREQRLAQIQMESDQNLTARKRRRRIRGLGHLPPDAPGSQPRYGSETSLDECKAFLSLDNPQYVTIRNEFQIICEANDIERKATALADHRWQNAKNQLVRENLHLSAIMNPVQGDMERKEVALDCICADVTKRMRTMKKAISIADANRNLGLNPILSKAIRREFYIILDQDHFTTKLACGDEHWEELRQKWFANTPGLQEIQKQGDPYKMRCIDVLARDAAKRFSDDAIKRDPTKKHHQLVHYGPGPGAAKFRSDGLTRTSRRNQKDLAQAAPHGESPATVTSNDVTATAAMATSATFALPAVHSSASLESTLPLEYAALDPALTALYTQPNPASSSRSSAPGVPQMQAHIQSAELLSPVSAYFRLSPESSLIGNHPRMWLGKLSARTIAALHTAASSKTAMAQVAKVLGIVKNATGDEDSWVIDTDDELQVYLEEAGEKATFVVTLTGGYA
nr:hypothetical protein CFP56_72812 [Quercus suber]